MRPDSVWASMHNHHARAVKVRRRSESIRKAARIGKYDYLGRLSVYDDLGRRNVVRLSYRRFLTHFRVGRRIRGDVSVPKTGAWVRLRSDLLIVFLRRWSRFLVHRLCSFMIGLVVYRIGALISPLKYG